MAATDMDFWLVRFCLFYSNFWKHLELLLDNVVRIFQQIQEKKKILNTVWNLWPPYVAKLQLIAAFNIEITVAQ